MIRAIILGGILVAAWLLGPISQHNAFACGKTQGCVMDVLLEDYHMMRDGRMEEAMRAGRENVEAFRALREWQQQHPAQQRGSTRR